MDIFYHIVTLTAKVVAMTRAGDGCNRGTSTNADMSTNAAGVPRAAFRSGRDAAMSLPRCTGGQGQGGPAALLSHHFEVATPFPHTILAPKLS